MPGYVIARVKVTDKEKYQEYTKETAEIIRKY